MNKLKKNHKDFMTGLVSKQLVVTIHPKHSYRVSFTDYIWLTFLDQPQLDKVNFAIIYFEVYK